MSGLQRLFAALIMTVLSVVLMPAMAQTSSLPGASPEMLKGKSTTAGPSVPVVPIDPVAASGDDEMYRLGPGDKMKITVYGEADLSGDFAVDAAGQVQFPLLGQVNAKGSTVHEFVATLTADLAAKYLRDPKVSVQIENYRPFYIIGEVNKPGEYTYESGLHVLAAIALAGGYTNRANDSVAYIRRNGSSTEESIPLTAATRIYPGDVVRIRERIF